MSSCRKSTAASSPARLHSSRRADAVTSAWGDPADDARVENGAFRLRILRAGTLIVAVQPDRGRRDSRKADYHDANLLPRHSYVAFYIWLREIARTHALIHLGTH